MGKGKYKGKGKKGKKVMKGQDSFKGMPAWKGKGKGGSKGKGGKPPQQNQQQTNVAQQTTSSSTPATAERQETAQAEANWGYDDAYWSNDWSEWDASYYGYDEYDWYSWPSYYVIVEEQAVTEDRHDMTFFLKTDRAINVSTVFLLSAHWTGLQIRASETLRHPSHPIPQLQDHSTIRHSE